MKSLKAKIFSVLLCFALLFGMLPAGAASGPEYVTREQAVASLFETIGYGALNETESDLSVFSDAGLADPQFTDELGKAITNGILTGTPGKALRPGENITRLEFALVVSRSMRELPDIGANGDFSDVPAAYTGDVNRLVRAGLMNGCGNGKFGSEDYLAQKQLDAILKRIEGLSATRPQDDFFYAMNQDWLRNAKLPAGYPGITSFDEVSLRNDGKLKTIVNDLIKNADTWKDGTKEQKMVDFYSTIVDVESRNKEGIEPIKPYLDRLEAVKTAQELLDAVAQLETETGVNPLFSFGPQADLLDSNRYSLYGNGLATALPAAYLSNENSQIKTLYQNFIAQMFMLSGSSEEAALKNAQDIYELERQLARFTLSNEEASKVENIYNPTTVDDLAEMFKDVDIRKYLNDLGYDSVENLIITDAGLMKKTGETVSDENIEVLKTYARYRMIISTGSLLTTDLENAITAFNNTFLGISAAMSEEDRAFNLLNSVMSGYLGRMFVEGYFSEEAKNDVEDIVKEIIATYEKRIKNLDWMSEDTKTAAISKLQAINLKIGYPDTWEDPLDGISIKNYKDGGSLLKNIFAIASAQTKELKTLLPKPVDKSKWTIPPHMVNAFYSATSNEIIFPAGILQAPFYDVSASREQNLGGIGAVIAHEITHAFDNNGAKFDKNGNMNNWWHEEDFNTFSQKCQDVIDLYDGLEIAPNAIVSGSLTVSENVADIGAMACILDIAEGMEYANYEELFESYANIWRLTATFQMYRYLATQDVHAPNKFRVNQVIRNFGEFYETYDVKPGDSMYAAPEDRVTVW